MHPFFETPVEYLKGVGPSRAEILRKELRIATFGDLLYHFPYRYIDRSRFHKISEINEESSYIQVKGKITGISTAGAKRAVRLIARFADETGSVELVWFKGLKWIREMLKTNVEYVVFGKPAEFNGRMNFVHPEIELVNQQSETVVNKLQPFYNSTEKSKLHNIDSKGILKLQRHLVQNLPLILEDTIPKKILEAFQMMPIRDALIQIHFPEDQNSLKKAQFRLKFEEFFYIQLDLLNKKLLRTEKIRGKKIEKIGSHFNNFYQHKLPFQLTNAQKRVLKEIRQDMGSGKQMNRLLQGDVGSGKTLVALMSMIMVLDNGYQSCIMAPTEILAQQHFNSISQLIEGTGMTLALLTGSVKEKDRKPILASLRDGTLNFVVGTHALIEERVQFRNAGLVVIDEQHRFGVEQRAKLWMKDNFLPHVLVMTATPIPRTLAMTLYGDLDVSIIDEMPPGRKPVRTEHRFESSRLRMFGFMKEQIAKGRQIYVVYPLIEESEKLDLMNLEQGYESLLREFPLPDYRISLVHGRMKAKDKDMEMQKFVQGKTQIMIATTVIEVGVNVPNATVMIVESAERFGLSQLHQLRGRVGRGADQSFCILMTGNKLSAEARQRMKTMVRTSDGFEIAEEDMRLRGPGDITGTQQSGVLNLRIADLVKDGQILEIARKSAITLLNEDPNLLLPANLVAREQLERRQEGRRDWSRIS